MPMYEYKCPHHGVFQELAPMQQHDQPKPCPQCQTVSARVIVLPPEIARVLRETRAAMERNEKARESPDVMTAGQYREREEERQARAAVEHRHHSGCGCNQGKKRKSNLMYTAEGNKMFPGMRPWMISH
ncbi:FmdB family zinc ribbon protein [Oceanobacter mangrovi]|uniref:FmdB family zinc ribbon protein n=1 Tax=Oceanobacter mangrovi TaxID=2862510 RepID=UPI001C8D417D|nr:FmdB family zinc ribbon protein [Oceanobacter mangrovi]